MRFLLLAFSFLAFVSLSQTTVDPDVISANGGTMMGTTAQLALICDECAI